MDSFRKPTGDFLRKSSRIPILFMNSSSHSCIKELRNSFRNYSKVFFIKSSRLPFWKLSRVASKIPSQFSPRIPFEKLLRITSKAASWVSLEIYPAILLINLYGLLKKFLLDSFLKSSKNIKKFSKNSFRYFFQTFFRKCLQQK